MKPGLKRRKCFGSIQSFLWNAWPQCVPISIRKTRRGLFLPCAKRGLIEISVDEVSSEAGRSFVETSLLFGRQRIDLPNRSIKRLDIYRFPVLKGSHTAVKTGHGLFLMILPAMPEDLAKRLTERDPLPITSRSAAFSAAKATIFSSGAPDFTTRV